MRAQSGNYLADWAINSAYLQVNESSFTHPNVAPCITRILLPYSHTPHLRFCMMMMWSWSAFMYHWGIMLLLTKDYAHTCRSEPTKTKPIAMSQPSISLLYQYVIYPDWNKDTECTNMLPRICVTASFSLAVMASLIFVSVLVIRDATPLSRTSNSSAVILSRSLNPILSSTCQHCKTNKGKEK